MMTEKKNKVLSAICYNNTMAAIILLSNLYYNLLLYLQLHYMGHRIIRSAHKACIILYIASIMFCA